MEPTKNGANELAEILKWFVPGLIYLVLVRIFIGDSPESFKTLDVVVGVPLLMGAIFIFVLMPPFVLYRWLREAPLIMEHPWTRGILLLCSCLVPLTAIFVAVLPYTAQGVRISRPGFSNLWLLAAFSGAAFLSFLAVSSVARPRPTESLPEREGPTTKSRRAEQKSTRAARPGSQMKFSEIVSLLAGISCIATLIYTIVRDLMQH